MGPFVTLSAIRYFDASEIFPRNVEDVLNQLFTKSSESRILTPLTPRQQSPLMESHLEGK